MSVSKPTLDRAGRRLLVVDDEPSVLNVIKLILDRANYDVVSCSTAREALELLQRQTFDCIITDAVMPDTDGYELVKAIRKEPQGEIPIIMLTRKRRRDDVKKAVEAGITEYVIKPIHGALLLDKIEMCLRKNQDRSDRRVLNGAEFKSDHSRATLMIPGRISIINETTLSMRVPFPMPVDTELELQATLFDKIGISAPLVKLVSCDEIPTLPNTTKNIFEAVFSFVNLLEDDLNKIQNWVTLEENELLK